MRIGVGIMLLGALAIGAAEILKDRMPILYMEQGTGEFIPQYYWALGLGLMVGGLAKTIQNMRFLKNPELKKKGEIAEADERNRLLGLRCWGYTGYSMFLVLYLGMLVGGFISVTVVKTIMVLIALFALLLLIFRRILMRSM